MRYVLTPWLLGTLLQVCAIQTAAAATGRYDLHVNLDPAAQSLEVDGSVTVGAPQGRTQELTWQLNRQLEVKVLKGPQVAGWSFLRDPNATGPGLLQVRLRRPVGPGDRVQFRIHYKGILSNRPEGASSGVSPQWTELGRALYWFPIQPQADPFTFRLEVRCKAGYDVASFGPFQAGPSGRTLEWKQPVTDLLLVAAPRARLHTWNPAPRVRLVTTDLGKEGIKSLSSAMVRLMGTFRKRLGPSPSASMTFIQAPRSESGSSAQPGLVIMGGVTDAQVAAGTEDILHQLAFQTAHAWWNGAGTHTWEVWLNESFAEYSAQVALRDLTGEPAYQWRIELKRRACQGLPPLWQFDPTARNAGALMENKGVVLLAELEAFVGRNRFAALCREVAGRKVNRTLQFLDLLEAREGKPVREAFQRRIMTL